MNQLTDPHKMRCVCAAASGSTPVVIFIFDRFVPPELWLRAANNFVQRKKYRCDLGMAEIIYRLTRKL